MLSGDRFDRLEVRNNSKNLIAVALVLAGAGIFLAWLGWTTSRPAALVMGGVSILCLPLVAWASLDRRPLLIADADGLTVPRFVPGKIAWHDIVAVRIFRFSTNTTLRLELGRMDDYLSRISALRSALLLLGLHRSRSEIRINLSLADHSVQSVFDAIIARTEAARGAR